MAPLRNRGFSSQGYPILQRVYGDIDEEIENLQQEIITLKTNLAKKYKRLNKLQTRKALKIQKDEIERRVRRETRFLVRKINPPNEDDDDDAVDELLKKSAAEHLSELCN